MDTATVIAVVVVLGVAAQLLAGRLRIPAILPLVVAGVLAGPVFGLIDPRAQFGPALEPLVGLAVAVILFEGGLRLRLHEFAHAAAGVHRLVYAGVPLALVLGTLAARYVGGFGWPVATVFGAISVVTGPTVVLPMLRHAMLSRRIASSLKWEAILNDPAGALLAVLAFQFWLYRAGGAPGVNVVADLARALAAGGVIGAGVAWLLGRAFAREWVPEYLKQPVTFALVLGVYVLANVVQAEAGLLAVTVMGVTLGNLGLPVMEEMRRFKEYLSTLLVSVVFVLLAASMDLGALARLPWSVWLVVPALLFVVRPLMVLIATARSRLDWRERIVAGWAAPRGVVAAATGGVLAPPLVTAGYADAAALEPLLFALVFASVILQGGTLAWLARRLGLAAHTRHRLLIVGASPWSTALARAVTEAGGSVLVVDNVWQRLSEPRLAGVPVFYGEILSDRAEATLELTDVGTLLAATPNDAYNALVCASFAGELGREQVYQLPMHRSEEGDSRAVMRTRRGRVAMADTARYELLYQRMLEGWRFQRTPLSGNFDYAAFRAQAAPEAMPVLLRRPDGALRLIGVDGAPEPRPDDVLVSFVPPRPEAGRNAAP